MTSFLINPYRFAAAGGDPYFANVSLLLHGDGTNNSTTITDSSGSPKTVTAVGDARISTARSKFGGASILFDGTDDRVTTPNTTPLVFRTGDFTVEGWFYGTTTALVQPLFSIGRFDSGILLRVGTHPANDPLYINGTFYNWNPTANFPLNTWNHVALVRSGSTIYVFVNGTSVFSATNSADINQTTETMIGSQTHEPLRSFVGNVDEFRITKGVARYTANFTPPTAPFPNS